MIYGMILSNLDKSDKVVNMLQNDGDRQSMSAFVVLAVFVFCFLFFFFVDNKLRHLKQNVSKLITIENRHSTCAVETK